MDMAGPLPVDGAVYPGIAADFLSLARQMRKIYEKVHYVRQKLKKMTDRTEIVARTFEFFAQAMTRAMRIKKLAQMFKRHGNLIKRVENESQQLVNRLTDIKDIFRFLISGKPVNLTDYCIAQYQWYRKSKKIIPSLFQDMEVLESSMRTIGILANTHMLLRSYKENGSQVLWEQIQSSQTMLKVEYQKLEYAQRGQEELLQLGLSRSRSRELKPFGQAVSQFLKREIPRLPSNESAPNSPSTMDSRSLSNSPELEIPLSVTPPSTPPQSDGYGEFELQSSVEEISMPRPKVHRRRTQSAPPGHISSLSPSSSFLSTVQEVGNHDEERSGQELHQQDQEQEKKGTYMQMPPFGPPRFGPRPPAGRTSPDSSSPSGSRARRQEDNPQRQSQSHSTLRRRNGSSPSVYGDGGEVTATHLTGFIGLPPESSRKAQNRGNQ